MFQRPWTKYLLLALAITPMLGNADDRQYLNNVLQPRQRLSLDSGIVITNVNSQPLRIQGTLDITEDRPIPPPPPRVHTTPSLIQVACDNPQLGGVIGGIKTQCWDTGQGRNHWVEHTPNGCLGREGSGNGGTNSCQCSCAY